MPFDAYWKNSSRLSRACRNPERLVARRLAELEDPSDAAEIHRLYGDRRTWQLMYPQTKRPPREPRRAFCVVDHTPDKYPHAMGSALPDQAGRWYSLYQYPSP